VLFGDNRRGSFDRSAGRWRFGLFELGLEFEDFLLGFLEFGFESFLEVGHGVEGVLHLIELDLFLGELNCDKVELVVELGGLLLMGVELLVEVGDLILLILDLFS
jgi:hypothetical protein